jgi:hypothetical protein
MAIKLISRNRPFRRWEGTENAKSWFSKVARRLQYVEFAMIQREESVPRMSKFQLPEGECYIRYARRARFVATIHVECVHVCVLANCAVLRKYAVYVLKTAHYDMIPPASVSATGGNEWTAEMSHNGSHFSQSLKRCGLVYQSKGPRQYCIVKRRR